MRTTRWLVLASLLSINLACSGVLSAQEESENFKACENYISHINAQQCLGLTYDLEDACQIARESTVDMAPYFECLVSNIQCTDDHAVMSISSCKIPTLSMVN